VRDVYAAGDGRLLLVTSDRLSAFDVVLNERIPDKGRVLTATAVFWFDRLRDHVPNHLITADLDEVVTTVDPDGALDWDPRLAGRVMLCRQAAMLPIEAIVRGYLAGSAWAEYRRTGTVHDM